MASQFGWVLGRAGAAAALFVVSLLVMARPCFALGSLLPAEGDAAAATEVRVAIAPSAAHTARWFSVRVRSSSGRVAWVMPLFPGTAIDPVNDAWFDALDQATAPRVVAPADVVPAVCGPTVFENTAGLPLHGVPPSQVAVLTSLAALRSFVSDQGFELPSAQLTSLAAATNAEYLALIYTSPAVEFWTETLRVLSAPGSAGGGLTGLLHDAEEPAVVTLFSFGTGRARFDAASEVAAPQLSATWLRATSNSDYLFRRAAHLNDEGAFVLESSETRSIHEPRTLAVTSDAGPESVVAVPSLVRGYFERAREARLTAESTRTCEERVETVRRRGEGGARVGTLCAPGILALRPASAPCVDAVRAGEIAPEVLRCGAADDLAFALAGRSPSTARLSRHVTRVRTASGADFTPSFVPGADVPSLWLAQRSDGAQCGAPIGAGEGPGGYVGAPVGGGGAHSGFGGQAGDSSDEGSYVEGREEACASSVGFACSSDDPPGYSSEDDDSCSSDGSEGDSCGSDSSGSGDDEGCSGDDESTGYDGETCSDDSSGPEDSGYDGETCSDDSSSSEDDSCAVRRPARVRPRLSVLTLALASVLLPLRRWSRRKQRKLSASRRT
ncbi:MAG TPA: hypothetical protein VI072_23175 [Polyangiaceae bacterium]